MNHERYSLPAILLHWLQAILIGWLLWLGWTMTDLPKGAERSAAYALHKSLGLLALLLTLLRLTWRWGHPPPAPVVSGMQAKLAHWGHWAIYGFLLFAPLAGYFASAFAPYGVKFFGMALPRLVEPNEALNSIAKEAHELIVWSGALLVVGHIAAVIHHRIKGEPVLQRMLPKS